MTHRKQILGDCHKCGECHWLSHDDWDEDDNEIYLCDECRGIEPENEYRPRYRARQLVETPDRAHPEGNED